MMKSWINQLLALIFIFLGASNLFAAERSILATSQLGRTLTLTFPDDPITSAATNANFCLDDEVALSEAKLWMPDMGHGSTPTKITVTNDHCTEIIRINFVMTGAWEIRVKLADEDSASFAFDVLAAP